MVLPAHAAGERHTRRYLHLRVVLGGHNLDGRADAECGVVGINGLGRDEEVGAQAVAPFEGVDFAVVAGNLEVARYGGQWRGCARRGCGRHWRCW